MKPKSKIIASAVSRNSRGRLSERNRLGVFAGAEAIIYKEGNKVIKDRIKKSYRITQLDEKIRKLRTRSETKLLIKTAQIINAPLPSIDNKDKFKIIMPFIYGKKLSEYLDKFHLPKQKQILNQIGQDVAKLHQKDIIHGDLTTSNMILVEEDYFLQKDVLNPNKKRGDKSYLCMDNQHSKIDKKKEVINNPKIFFIDFGLGYISKKIEDKAVDIHLLKQALEAKHFENWEVLFKEFEKGYKTDYSESKNIFERLNAVEKRGRYKN
jgi:Kae1-associated kinase Bud32